MNETKSEIRARIDELNKLYEEYLPDQSEDVLFFDYVRDRKKVLEGQLQTAEEDLYQSVIRSHEVICAVKQMEAKAAYGQDPAVYYTLAICGEAGEMANKIVKALRNGDDPEAAKVAVTSELPDVIIYSAVLAHVLDIDLTKLVNEKVRIVIERAESGYYGGPLKSSV